ncbi:hypothetical protein KPH14_003778 [Odynerus spinipes]|uniref:OTU domain-containing protein n=1 Tax=Odynerus spinipes TaxID=1348599 RepID=A0AAD9VUV0_9HYME|nr:hypothetical protein KPH14_003778 [Odynerus spinipes]
MGNRKIVLAEECVHRPTTKNESGCVSYDTKHYLAKGDSSDDRSRSKFNSENSYATWKTERNFETRLAKRSSTCTQTSRKRKGKRASFNKGGTARLRCTEGTFRVHKIYGDGNCMFRAISYILWRNEDEHRSLRATVAQHIRNNWHDYGPFVMAEWNMSDPEEYYDYMSMVGTFASELECTVATKLHRMNLSIYREIEGRDELERVFHNRVSIHFQTARLLFTGRSESGHYDVLFME